MGIMGWQGTKLSPALLVKATVQEVGSIVSREKSKRQVNRKLFCNPDVTKASPCSAQLRSPLSQSLPGDGMSPLAPGLPGVTLDLFCMCCSRGRCGSKSGTLKSRAIPQPAARCREGASLLPDISPQALHGKGSCPGLPLQSKSSCVYQ